MSRSKKILFAVLGLVALFFAYSFFFKGDGAGLLTVEEPVLVREDIKGRELLSVLLGLNRITLNEEIFSSDLFTSLQDFSIVLPDSEVAGRQNPFAPIGAKEE